MRRFQGHELDLDLDPLNLDWGVQKILDSFLRFVVRSTKIIDLQSHHVLC